MINLSGRISWEINQFSNNLTSIWRKNSWEATIIAVEKPMALWWYLKKPIEHLLNRLYCTFSCNITFKPFAFDVLFATNNCSSRLVNDSNICHAVRSSEPPVFANSVSIAHVPTWLWLRFSLKTQPWTLFQGAYRAVFLTAGNNYLKQLKPPFISKMSTISTWQNWRSQKTQQHRKSGDFGAVGV